MKSNITKAPSASKSLEATGVVRNRAVRMMSTGDIVKTPTSSSFLGKLGSAGHGHGSFLDGGADEANYLVEKLNRVKEELQITQESFISRERAYKIRIDELEEQLAKKRKERIGWMDSDPKISDLKKKQAQILSNVALVQDRFSRVVREQEQDLLRAFQARLLDVQAELEMQKSKKDDGAVAYIELSKTKEYDVEREKVKADLKERQNQALLQANNRLKSQFASREEDRNYLVMQINMARNDNERLRKEYDEHEVENKKLTAQVGDLSNLSRSTSALRNDSLFDFHVCIDHAGKRASRASGERRRGRRHPHACEPQEPDQRADAADEDRRRGEVR
jgi:hypothetical protein